MVAVLGRLKFSVSDEDKDGEWEIAKGSVWEEAPEKWHRVYGRSGIFVLRNVMFRAPLGYTLSTPFDDRCHMIRRASTCTPFLQCPFLPKMWDIKRPVHRRIHACRYQTKATQDGNEQIKTYDQVQGDE